MFNKKLKLVIFDNDGVLIDSDIVWHKVNTVEMNRLGFPMTLEKSIDLFTGISKDEFEKVMVGEFNKILSDDEIMTINKKTEESYDHELKAITGMSAVLDFLEQKNIMKCIASNGDNEYVQRTLDITNLSRYFNSQAIFTSAMAKNRKPAPDVFLQAADYFNVDPENCLVIEDHLLGIAASKAANMSVIGFLGASHLKNPRFRKRMLEANPMIIVDNAQELLDLIQDLLK